MTADRLVEILKARGCVPERQRSLHEVRDAVHETVHVLQSGSKTYDRETIHRALVRKAKNVRSTLVRYELQARAVEKIICEKFKIEYDLEHWAFIMWMETIKSLNVNIGEIEVVKQSICIVEKQLETKLLVDRVLRLRMPRKAKAA